MSKVIEIDPSPETIRLMIVAAGTGQMCRSFYNAMVASYHEDLTRKINARIDFIEEGFKAGNMTQSDYDKQVKHLTKLKKYKINALIKKTKAADKLMGEVIDTFRSTDEQALAMNESFVDATSELLDKTVRFDEGDQSFHIRTITVEEGLPPEIKEEDNGVTNSKEEGSK